MLYRSEVTSQFDHTRVCLCVVCACVVCVCCVCVVCVLCVCVVCVLCVCVVCVCVPSFPLSSPALSFLATSILLPRAHVASILLIILLSLLLSLSRLIRVLLVLLFCVQSPLLVSTEPLSAYVAFHSPSFHLHEMIDRNGLMVTTHLMTCEPSVVLHTLSHIREALLTWLPWLHRAQGVI